MLLEIKRKEKDVVHVGELPLGAAFNYNGDWYLIIYMKDDNIQQFDEFFANHVITDDWNETAECYSDYITCIHIGSHYVCYIRKDAYVADYGPATLQVRIEN